MATATVKSSPPTVPEHDQAVEKKIQQFRELFADAPEVGKKALENALHELKSQTSDLPPAIESAGRIGTRHGKVSELTDHRPVRARRSQAAARVPAVVERQPLARRGQGRHPPQHALRVLRQRHEAALRHGLRRRLGHLYRRLRDEDSRRSGHHLLRLRRLAGDSQPEGEGLDRQAPDHGGRLVRRLSGSDGGGDPHG